MKPRAAWLLAALALLSGCGTKATEYPLAAGQKNQLQAPLDVGPGRPLVVLAFSGGGSRAAALAAVVVNRLNGLTYESNGQTRTLASDIAVVSSVSGGSVYNADLGLNGPGNAGSFARRIQAFDGIGWLERKALNPFTWIGLQLAGKTRVDVQQEMIEDLLQTKATMAALNQPGKPITLLNASDMVAGQVFTFDRATLDDVCFDYNRVPVSLGVNASAAVPIAYTPVLLHNDSYLEGGCPGSRNTNLPYRTALQSPGGPYANLEAFRVARYRQSLRNEPVTPTGSTDPVPPYRTPVYLRLVDGGVADNSGLTGLRRALLGVGAPADLGRLVAQGRVRQVVVIVVNARSDIRNDLDTSSKYTDILTIANGISGTLVDSASANSAALFQDFVKLLADERDSLIKDGQVGANFGIYPISIDFDQLPAVTQAQRDEQQAVKSIGTSWTLPAGSVALLDRVAGELLWRHPCFNALVTDIDLRGKREAEPVPNTRCPVKPPPRAGRSPPA